MLSLIIPVYRNEAGLPRLFAAMERIADALAGQLEIVFVVDGSPDRLTEVLRERLPFWPIRTRLIELSRNFGSFAAILAGLSQGTGDYFAVMAADLQEPPELVLEFGLRLAAGQVDIVLGCRTGRADPWWSRVPANLFWRFYRRFVFPDMPAGGIDVFGCTRQVRDRLVECREINTSLVTLLLWLGFRRDFVLYERQARLDGASAWTFGRKLAYALESVFSFTDLRYARCSPSALSASCSRSRLV